MFSFFFYNSRWLSFFSVLQFVDLDKYVKQNFFYVKKKQWGRSYRNDLNNLDTKFSSTRYRTSGGLLLDTV